MKNLVTKIARGVALASLVAVATTGHAYGSSAEDENALAPLAAIGYALATRDAGDADTARASDGTAKCAPAEKETKAPEVAAEGEGKDKAEATEMADNSDAGSTADILAGELALKKASNGIAVSAGWAMAGWAAGAAV